MTAKANSMKPEPDRLPISERGPAPKKIVVAYGFWNILLSDFVLFSAFFAAYAVQAGATAGGPSGRDLFDLKLVAVETALLLLSSFTCGMASLAMMVRNERWFQIAMAVTGVLGAGFLALELHEFARLVGEGAGPQRSAFLSAFFALAGCHGLHVTLGLIWLTTMMAQIRAKGFRDDIERRVTSNKQNRHAHDIIWVALFTTVYLLGSGI